MKEEKKYMPENNKPESQDDKLRCDADQLAMLKRCSDKKDMTEWNQWRERNPKENILLNGANLTRAFLQGANLGGVKLRDATLWEAKLQRTNLRKAFLQGADLRRAELQGAEFGRAKLQKADFSRAIVDGETLIWDCEIDKKTKFEGVGLGNMRIYPKEKQLLEYNIRRMNWGEWYKDHKFLQWPVKWFWGLSDYGHSTKQIIFSFFKYAMLFALIYYVWGCVDVYVLGIKERPGVVSNLFVLEDTNEAVAPNQVPARSIYFSVITMTTLGFGDMYANPATINDNPYAQARSGWGHFLLMVQVLLGYVMLGALVTRFAVLFTAGGPAGSFTEISKTDENKEKTKDEQKQ